jgi:HEPN domain-containing protein
MAVNRRELQQLSRLRIAEARTLLSARMYEGAYYLAGYALECALKACVAKKVKRHDFPDRTLAQASHTHSLETLLGLSGLKPQHETRAKAEPQFAVNWAVAKDWSAEDRYVVGVPEKKARDLYTALAGKRHGVLSWLRKHW